MEAAFNIVNTECFCVVVAVTLFLERLQIH